MRLLALTLIGLFAFLPFLNAQDIGVQPPIEFGEISLDDLTMTVYERDTAAEAVVLCDYETVEININNGAVLVRKMRHTRIKILKQAGFDYGDVEVPYYSYQKSERFFFGKAAIYLPDGTVDKLNKKSVFEEQINDYWTSAKFAFPKLAPGCIIEYIYYVNSDRYYEPEDWFFQGGIPVRHSEIRVGYPAILGYNYFFQGNESMKAVLLEKNHSVYEGDNGRCTIKPGKFIFENAPAMRPEAYITTMNDYRARVRFQLSEVKRSDGSVSKVTESWGGLRKELENFEFFGRHYLKKGSHKEITEPLLPRMTTMSSEYEKAAFAYSYVTQNVNWNGRYDWGGGTEKLNTLLETGSGHSGQLNMLLLALLREADIVAGPALTSTRSHGKMFEDYPILDQFNHMLIYAVLDGKPFFIDATEPLRPIGYPDVEALNDRVWHVERGWMNIRVLGESRDAFAAQLTLSPEGSISGEIIGGYTGYNAVPERRHYVSDTKGGHWSERLSEKYTDVTVEEVKHSEIMELDDSFKDTVRFQIDQAAMVAGDLIYFSPVVYTAFSESPFKQNNRNYPVNFPYSFREQHNIKVAYPEGYVVEELPESVRVRLPKNGGDFMFAIEENAPGVLTLNINLSIRQLIYFPDEYKALKELFDLFVDKLGEQVVLRKSE